MVCHQSHVATGPMSANFSSISNTPKAKNHIIASIVSGTARRNFELAEEPPRNGRLLEWRRMPHHDLKDTAMKHILTMALLGGFAVAPAMANEALAKSKQCVACHAVDKKLVGPAYKDVAKKYAGQSDAAAKLAAKILAGGSGTWGAVPMPANTQVSQAEALQLANWVLSLK